MFGINKKPATDEAPPKVKTRAEQIQDGDREWIAREECRLTNDRYYFLDFVKPKGDRGLYEILKYQGGTFTVVLEHEQCDFGTAGRLYGPGNFDLEPDGYTTMCRTDGQRAAMRRMTKGMAAADDLAVVAARVAKFAREIGDGGSQSAERRINLINELCRPLMREMEAFEIERNQLARARFAAQRLRDERLAAAPAERAEAEARKAAAAKALREQSLADAESARAYHAEMAQIRERKNQELREAQARRLAEEAAEAELWRAEQERARAEEAAEGEIEKEAMK